jgi:predicted GIY-YIG superfamily endonuclease
VKAFYVYMMTNRSRVVLYTRITNSLMRRVSQHQNGEIEGFTKTYKVNRLVYYDRFNDPRDAICAGKGNQRLAARKEELVGRADEPKVGGFIPDAFSTYERSLAPLGMTKEGI